MTAVKSELVDAALANEEIFRILSEIHPNLILRYLQLAARQQ